MLILICSLINISGNNSPIEKRNLEPVNDGKRTLDEQTDNNYIIIQFNETVAYDAGTLLHDYNIFISKIIDENGITIDESKKFIVTKGTKLYVYFNGAIQILLNFFSSLYDANCKDLISVDLSHFDTSSVTYMIQMFYGCSSLQTLNLSNFNTLSVKDMGSMFYRCSSLQVLNLSYFNTSSVADMNRMVYGCSSLQTLNLSNFDTSSNDL